MARSHFIPQELRDGVFKFQDASGAIFRCSYSEDENGNVKIEHEGSAPAAAIQYARQIIGNHFPID
jgi:hypothetical protein